MVGLVTTQGDEAMRADVARQTFGVDGTGITIGVLSTSFDLLGTASDDVANGDLPANVNVLAEAPPEFADLFGPATDEGRAMLQLIHDVAPGANLLFHTAVSSEAATSPLEFDRASAQAFADGIRALAAAGANIIVDDIGFASNPFFQDGIVAQAVNEVVAQGVLYFSSAANGFRNSYESAFNPSGVFDSRFGGELHDFDLGLGVDTTQSITLPINAPFGIAFQWDSPFFSLNPNSGGSPNDLDIFLLDSSGNIVASSTESNVGGDPVEFLNFINDGSYGSDQFNLAITLREGAAPSLMKYIDPQTIATIDEYDTASSTVFGHANAAGAFAVGAAAFYETPAFGVDPANLEEFSSVGGTPILFDTNGDRLPCPETRRQPRIVGPDRGNTTFFGRDSSQDADTFPNFGGTSAAAPHIAAVAALILQANPNLNPSEVYSILEQTALDMDDPGTPGFDQGYDFATGYGFVQADRAVELALAQNPCSTSEDALLAGANNGILVGDTTDDPLHNGGSHDQYIYNSLSDGTEAITNFNSADDQSVLTSLFDSLGYSCDDLICDRYLHQVQLGADTQVQIDPSHYGCESFSPVLI
ncbi:S8 family peptidase [Allocoleopsis sp.]|uniref:S8 family peptidase n=1 Tax=Allocoleopsis sp. TaxID=3088169 RepID=UPI002FD56215